MDLKQELGAKQKKGTALSQFFQNRDGVVSMGPSANEYPAGTEDRNVGTTCYHREKQRDGPEIKKRQAIQNILVSD